MTAGTANLSRLEIASQIRESVGWLWHPVRLEKDDAQRLTSKQPVD